MANYDLSLKILDRKTQAIEDSGADIVTTTCSGCLLQLMDGCSALPAVCARGLTIALPSRRRRD